MVQAESGEAEGAEKSGSHGGEGTIKLEPTLNFRFVRRRVDLDPFGFRRIMQQLFISRDGIGAVRWIDVPEVDETDGTLTAPNEAESEDSA